MGEIDFLVKDNQICEKKTKLKRHILDTANVNLKGAQVWIRNYFSYKKLNLLFLSGELEIGLVQIYPWQK